MQNSLSKFGKVSDFKRKRMKTIITILLLLMCSVCFSQALKTSLGTYPQRDWADWNDVDEYEPLRSGNYYVWLKKYRPDGTHVEHEAIVWFSVDTKKWNVEPFYQPHTAFKNADVTHWTFLLTKPKTKN